MLWRLLRFYLKLSIYLNELVLYIDTIFENASRFKNLEAFLIEKAIFIEYSNLFMTYIIIKFKIFIELVYDF